MKLSYDMYHRYISTAIRKLLGASMSNSHTAKVNTAKVFMTGRSQAVRLPMEFRFEGTEVRIRRFGNGVVLEPLEPTFKTAAEWFAAIDAVRGDTVFDVAVDDRDLLPVDDLAFDEFVQATKPVSARLKS
jgi:antitoxin VapB